MHTNKTNRIFIFALLLSALLSACGVAPTAAHQVTQLGALESIRGMQAAVSGAPGTFIMQNSEQFILAWPRGTEYAYTVIGEIPQALPNAVKYNTINFAQFVKALEGDGWKYIAPAALPKGLASLLLSYSAEMVMAGAQTLPSIFVVPVLILTPAIPSNQTEMY